MTELVGIRPEDLAEFRRVRDGVAQHHKLCDCWMHYPGTLRYTAAEMLLRGTESPEKGPDDGR